MNKKIVYPSISHKELKDLLKKAIDLSNQNKITVDNTWNIKILQHLNKAIQGRSFQENSITIDTATKVYQTRVDSMHFEAMKILNLMNQKRKRRYKKRVEEDEQGKKKKKKRKIGVNTLTENEKIQLNDDDFVCKFDPLLIQRTLQTFEIGNINSLLLNNLFLNERGGMILELDKAKIPLELGQIKTTVQTPQNLQNLQISNTSQSQLMGSITTNKMKVNDVPIEPNTQEENNQNIFPTPDIPVEDGMDIDDGGGEINFDDDGGEVPLDPNIVSGENDTLGLFELDQEEFENPIDTGGGEMDDAEEAKYHEDSVIEKKNINPEPGMENIDSENDYNYFNELIIGNNNKYHWTGLGRWNLKVKKGVGEKKNEKKKKKKKKKKFSVKFSDFNSKDYVGSPKDFGSMHLKKKKNLDEDLPIDFNVNEEEVPKFHEISMKRRENEIPVEITHESLQENVTNDILLEHPGDPPTDLPLDGAGDFDDFGDFGGGGDFFDEDELVPDRKKRRLTIQKLLNEHEDFNPLQEVQKTLNQVNENVMGDVQLMEAPHKIPKMKIRYFRNKQKTDIKLLKDTIWNEINNNNILHFVNLYERIKEHEIGENVSVSSLFISILHLANEKIFEIRGNDTYTNCLIRKDD